MIVAISVRFVWCGIPCRSSCCVASCVMYVVVVQGMCSYKGVLCLVYRLFLGWSVCLGCLMGCVL